MSDKAITLIIGALLLAVGLFGGNIRAKDVDVGPVGPIGRALSFGFGCLFLGLGFGLQEVIKDIWPTKGTTNPTSTPTATPASTPTATPASTPSTAPSATSTAAPASTATLTSTATPTSTPTATPTSAATTTPQVETTDKPIEVRTRVTISSVLSRWQTYENTRVFVNDVEILSFALSKTRVSQSFKVWVNPGDRYSLVGTSGFRWVKDSNEFTYDHETRGKGDFADDASTLMICIKREWLETLEASLRPDCG